MRRLIDVDALKDALVKITGLKWELLLILVPLCKIIENAPIICTICTKPQKVGKWIPFGSLDLDGNQQYNCSLYHCLEVHTPAAKVSYCWNCGAMMEDKDGTTD